MSISSDSQPNSATSECGPIVEPTHPTSSIEAIADRLFSKSLVEQDTQLVFDQYKLYVELADRLGARRQQANQFFIGINSGLCAIIGYVAKTAPELSVVTWTVPLVGMLLSYLWAIRLKSYGQLLAAKFNVIEAFERQLPSAPFAAEWTAIRVERGVKPYRSFSGQEAWIPRVFIGLYAMLSLFLGVGLLG